MRRCRRGRSRAGSVTHDHQDIGVVGGDRSPYRPGTVELSRSRKQGIMEIKKFELEERDFGLMSDEEFNPERLESGVRDIVVLLRSKGFRTKNSCHGYAQSVGMVGDEVVFSKDNFHSHPMPWVLVGEDENSSPEETRLRLERELIDAGYCQFQTSVQHRVDEGGEVSTAGIELQFLVAKVEMCRRKSP